MYRSHFFKMALILTGISQKAKFKHALTKVKFEPEKSDFLIL